MATYGFCENKCKQEVYTKNEVNELTTIETIKNENGTAIKFPDGTMICHGHLNVPANTGGMEIYFPYSFTNEGCTIFFTNIYTNSPNISYSVGTTYSNYTTVYIKDLINNATPVVACKAMYTAIGRWK